MHLEDDEEAASSQVSATALGALDLSGDEIVRLLNEGSKPCQRLASPGNEWLSVIYLAFCEMLLPLLFPRQP